ncbi:DUF4304 domain-containing protein [Pseudobacillus badius]|uniref:DUF4304 domain-containing protein n=1 Tax=Bacillus badius TaxID=1455 RepID=UPI001CBF4C51|nr:DUF4304 domain-containing protein [Bacillus badius]UAT29135.1 DUF4304 domain-containing protein [Bacillus badius]GLY09665.1 hypothetical protein Bbad01_08810 [Bacillus badius]
MDKTNFKESIHQFLLMHGFKKQRKFFIKEGVDALVVIDLQKSNFSNSYYINYGFIITQLHDNNKNVKLGNTDINLRMNVFIDGKLVPEFDLDGGKLTEEILKSSLEKEYKENIEPSLDIKGLRNLIIKYPGLENSVSPEVREILNIQ